MPSAEARTFHRIGARLGPRLGRVGGTGLRPALFAGLGDLARLRYDYPVILVGEAGDGPIVEALSGRIDAILAEVAPPGAAGERLRRTVLRLERGIREAVAGTDGGTLTSLWDAAAERLAAGDAQIAADLAAAREALRLDGEVVDCDAAMPARLVTHAWRTVQEGRTRRMRASIDALRAALAGLVQADFGRSAAGRQATMLRAGMGTLHQELFDFETMARLLATASGASGLSVARRRRIDEALAVLGAQQLFGDRPDEYIFDDLEAAADAYRERLPEMAELVRAMAIAELEVAGRYVEATHDEVFRGLDSDGLGPEELALFPDYLVRVDADAAARSLLTSLVGGAPLKIIATVDDAFGPGGHLAESAMAVGDAFVLQTTASHLYAARDRVRAALEYRGPALISVFTGPASAAGIPPYLLAAAAIESRAVPAFTYDPSAGPDWAQRLALHDNPQPDGTWPRHSLRYADEAMQRVTEEVAVTPADLALCDPRRAADFARLSLERPEDGLVPIDRWLADGAEEAGSVPFVHAVDAEGALHRLVIEERLARMVRRRGDRWHRLRQLAGVGGANGVAAAVDEAVHDAVEAPTEVSAEPVVEAAVPEAPPDDPYIETPRCTTCNECTGINGRMFAYNENRQAYIADPGAGTYRELVEAAESCQVAIIHPGKPRDPSEPGLDELLERAAAFA